MDEMASDIEEAGNPTITLSDHYKRGKVPTEVGCNASNWVVKALFCQNDFSII